MGTLVGGTLGSSLGRTWPAAHPSEDRLRVRSSAVARWRRLGLLQGRLTPGEW